MSAMVMKKVSKAAQDGARAGLQQRGTSCIFTASVL